MESNPDCPRCGFASYGARSVHGNKAYRYQTTQQPWRDHQLAKRAAELDRIIESFKPPQRSVGERMLANDLPYTY